MSTISVLIEGVSEALARSALYYVGRYVKQARVFEEYKKDIFDDEVRSAPSEEVKGFALAIISALEAREGTPASKWNDQTINNIIDEITTAEEQIGPEPTEAETAFVERFSKSFRMPSTKA